MARRTVLVRYYGDVQGVGFRATARSVAGGYAIHGWVKNEPDGSVSLIATAEEAELEAFLGALRGGRLARHIDREVSEPADPALVLTRGFSVRD